jgi:hypothetical protein
MIDAFNRQERTLGGLTREDIRAWESSPEGQAHRLMGDYLESPAAGSVRLDTPQTLDRQPAERVSDAGDAFATEQDRTDALAKAQGSGTFKNLAKRLKTGRSRLYSWRKDRLAKDKTDRARSRIEVELSTILGTLK